MKHKNTIKTGIFILMIILTIYSATAITFTQFLHSETLNPISKVRTTGTYAMFMDSANNIFYWNSTDFKPISKPSGETLPTLTFEKASNKKFYFTFGNTTTQKIYEYAPNNTMSCASCWTLKQTINSDSSAFFSLRTGHQDALACVNEGNGYNSTSNDSECWIAETNTTALKGIKLMNAVADITFTETSAQSLARFVSSTRIGIEYTNTAPLIQGYEYTGTSVILQGTFGSSGTIVTGGYSRFSDSKKVFFGRGSGTGSQVYKFNSTLATYQTFASTSLGSLSQIQLSSNGLTAYYSTTSNDLFSQGYFTGASQTTEFTAGQNIQTFDLDWDTGNFWIGANNGLIYNSLSPPPPPPVNLSFAVSTTPSSNPTLYGQTVIFTTTVSNNFLTYSTTNVTFYNSTGTDVYNYQFVPNAVGGYTTSNSIESFVWTNFQIGTYNVTSVMYDGGTPVTHTFQWVVSANATINRTNYTSADYYGNTDYTNIFSITKVSSNKVYTTGNDGFGQYVLSYDVTNPNNFVRTSKLVNDTTGIGQPTSISLGNGVVYLGTDNELYKFTNGATGVASSLIQDASPHSFISGSQYVTDLQATNVGDAWVCNQGIIFDSATFFNQTTNSTSTTLSSTDPCKGIFIDGNRLFVKKDTSVKIYNLTNNNLLATITGLTNTFSGAINDVMSVSGNNFYVLTDLNRVKRYNITTIASPTYISQCYAQYGVDSIEALFDDQVVLGVEISALNNGIRVCDFSRTDLLDVPSNTYTSIPLFTYSGGEIPNEIIALDNNGKFAVAENNKIGIHFYTRSESTTATANPPSLAITTVTDNPYVNQSISVTLIASDPDTATNLLFYDYDCSGIQAIQINYHSQNQFSCTYTTNGTKTIKAFVTDGTSQVSTTKNLIVQNLPSGSSFLNFKTVDSITGLGKSGVTVTVLGDTSKVTNTGGYASFIEPVGTYTVTFACPNCQPYTQVYETRTNEIVVAITNTLIGGVLSNQLTIHVIDENNLPVQYAGVTVTDPITTIAKVGQTDIQGNVNFLNLPTGVNLGITAKHPTQNRDTFITQTNTLMQVSEQKTLTMQVNSVGAIVSMSSGRGCGDYVQGIILCSPLNVNGTGDTCTQDSDCIGGRCSLGAGSYRVCSNMNYTVCDEAGYDRGSFRCATIPFMKKSGQVISDTILDYLLYVLAFVILIFVILLIISKVRK